MSKIELIDIINTVDRALGAPPTCIESLLDKSPLDEDLVKEVDAIVSVMLVEVIKNSVTSNSVFTRKLPSNFVYNCKTEAGIKSVTYSEWVKLAEMMDSKEMTKEEFGYIKVLLTLNSRKQYIISSAMMSCYFLNTV